MDASVQRIVVVPFGSDKPLLLTNNGVGKGQTALLPLDTKTYAVAAAVMRAKGRLRAGDDIAADTGLRLVRRGGDERRGDGQRGLRVLDDALVGTGRFGPKAWARVKLVPPVPATQPR